MILAAAVTVVARVSHIWVKENYEPASVLSVGVAISVFINFSKLRKDWLRWVHRSSLFYWRGSHLFCVLYRTLEAAQFLKFSPEWEDGLSLFVWGGGDEDEVCVLTR